MLRGVKKNHILLTLILKKLKLKYIALKPCVLEMRMFHTFFRVEAIIYLFVYLFTVPLTSMYNTLSGKKSWGKVTKFLASDKIFLQLSFSRPVFFPDFFSPDKKSSQFFFKLLLILLLLFPIILQNLLLPCFFDVRYLSWFSKIVLTKFSKCEWKWNWNWEWNWSRKSGELKKLVG